MANSLTDIYVGVKKNDTKRNENDLYRTPPLVTYILQKYTNVPKHIIEPCAGYGNIAVELQRCGHDVLCYDLNDYENSILPIITNQDALYLEKQEGYEGIVTNPPYFKDLPRKLAEKFVQEYSFVAFLVRLTFLEGMKRNNLFRKNPPTDIIVFSDRIRFSSDHIEPIELEHQKDGMIAYCWVVWNKEATHDNTKMNWVLLKDEYDEWRAHYERNITDAS